MNYELIIRLVLSIICGYIVGHERKNRAKEAGVRTHMIICLGACLIMIVSKYGFNDIIDGKYDASRIASQVVSGIGFLGAGMILVKNQTISGLTTAAGMWATSGVGLAIGAGMYLVGIATAILIVLIEIIFHTKALRPSYREVDILSIVVEKDKMKRVSEYLKEEKVETGEIHVTKINDSFVRLEVEVTLKDKAAKNKVLTLFTENDWIQEIEIKEG